MINKLVQECLDISIKEVKKHKNIERIKKDIISPLIDHIAEILRPYIFATCVFMTTIVVMIFIVLLKVLKE